MILKYPLLLIFILISFFANSKKADLDVVATENYLLQYQENGNNKGSTIEILEIILKESGLTADIKFMPWARALAKTKNNPNTLVLSMIRTAERESQFYWLGKVSELARVFIYLADKPENKVVNDEEAKRKTIAVVRNSSNHKSLLRKGFSEDNNLYLVSETDKTMDLFIKGKVDLIYTDPNLLKAYLKETSQSNIQIGHQEIKPEFQQASYIAANKNTDKHLLKRLQAAMDRFKKTDHYLYLLHK